jgi:RimJ/RimL family protein N-acetyltransferase
VIETERLLLRPIALADLDALVSFHEDPAVAEFMSPFTAEEARERFGRWQQSWDERGYGPMAVVDRTSGALLGRSGLRYWPQFDETEVGWLLRRDAWGNGYATEAARACLRWGFAEFDFGYLTAMIEPRNERSLAVAARLGMTPLREDALLGFNVIVHGIGRAKPSP